MSNEYEKKSWFIKKKHYTQFTGREVFLEIYKYLSVKDFTLLTKRKMTETEIEVKLQELVECIENGLL